MRIAARFNGPPGSGNGGYSAGLFAQALTGDDDKEVTLRLPPPLETELAATPTDEGLVITSDDRVVAEVRPTSVEESVAPVSLAEAVLASQAYSGIADHPFPTCYVCGTARDDGLGVFPGRLAPGRTAAAFTVPVELASPEIVWAALDCPGGWATPMEADSPYVLGRLAVHIDALPAAGDTCVVVGELTGLDGRKAHVLTTLYTPDGHRLATARATWVAIV